MEFSFNIRYFIAGNPADLQQCYLYARFCGTTPAVRV